MVVHVLFIAFCVSLGALAGFLVGVYLTVRECEGRRMFWRDKALELQQRVHDLEGH